MYTCHVKQANPGVHRVIVFCFHADTVLSSSEPVKEEKSDPGFVEKLVTQIIKNVQVQFIHTRSFQILPHSWTGVQIYTSCSWTWAHIFFRWPFGIFMCAMKMLWVADVCGMCVGFHCGDVFFQVTNPSSPFSCGVTLDSLFVQVGGYYVAFLLYLSIKLFFLSYDLCVFCLSSVSPIPLLYWLPHLFSSPRDSSPLTPLRSSLPFLSPQNLSPPLSCPSRVPLLPLEYKPKVWNGWNYCGGWPCFFSYIQGD